MNKSIKLFENYLKKLGKNSIYWDENFLRFLRLNDPILVRRLYGERLP